MTRRTSTTLARALQLLGSFANGDSTMTLSDLAPLVGSTPGGIYSLLSTFEDFGYLERDKHTKQYRLGSAVLVLANRLLADLDVRTIAKPFLADLARQFTANTHLAILYEHEVLYLERQEGSPSVVLPSIVGGRVPIHCTALGKAIAAFDRDEERHLLGIDELPRQTPHTVTDPIELSHQFEHVRELGYAVDAEEFHLGNVCFAAPVRSYMGTVVAAISISFAASRPEADHPNEATEVLMDAASAISKALGYSPLPALP